MNLAGITGAVTRNKTAIGAGAAVVVVIAALRARAKTKTTTTTAAAAAPVATTPGYTTTGYTSGGSGYDSTASDVYNAIQPQLEALQKLYTTPTPPIPVPAAPAASTDPRQAAIQADYNTFLKRDGAPAEINWWDATGQNLDWIRAGIVGSNEAQGK